MTTEIETAETTPFEYGGQIEDVIREDLVHAHRRAWARLAAPGAWWTGRERVAIAAEARAADYCGFCRERREALSPYAEAGDHDDVSRDILPAAAIDAVHRLITDAGRLTQSWFLGLSEEGVPDTHYIELVSVVSSVRSVDSFHRAMGLDPEPLPRPCEGEPSRIRPAAAAVQEAWVPMLPNRRQSGDDSDLWPGPTANVIRALSLVPDAVRWLKELSAAHYLAPEAMTDFTKGRGPLSRAQTELVAGRVSAINECFY